MSIDQRRIVHSPHLQLARRIGGLFAGLPNVQAVALGGSLVGGSDFADKESDIDLYVYSRGEIPLESRQLIVEQSGGATQTSLDLEYWGRGDEWLNASTGIEVDISYFDTAWMQDRVSRVVENHQANLGYTTCFWHTIRQSIAFSDPSGWFASLQQRCQVEYPEALRRNIIALNRPVLRAIVPSYANQLAKAVKRHDLISINHGLSALFASYFDILFALNRKLHPGEKRLVEFALKSCEVLPSDMDANIALILTSADISRLPERVDRLLDNLDQALEGEGLRSEMQC
jgi:Domain of unknown function (DUF4037)